MKKNIDKKAETKKEFILLISNKVIKGIYSRVIYYNFVSLIGIVLLIIGLILLFGIPDDSFNENINFGGQFILWFGFAIFLYFKFWVFFHGIKALELCWREKTIYFQKYIYWWMFFYLVGDFFLLKAKKQFYS